jgi:hypothetical protein
MPKNVENTVEVIFLFVAEQAITSLLPLNPQVKHLVSYSLNIVDVQFYAEF